MQHPQSSQKEASLYHAIADLVIPMSPFLNLKYKPLRRNVSPKNTRRPGACIYPARISLPQYGHFIFYPPILSTKISLHCDFP